MAAVGLTRDFYVRSAVIRGDVQTYASQLQILIDGCEILVATLGHLLDFAERRKDDRELLSVGKITPSSGR